MKKLLALVSLLLAVTAQADRQFFGGGGVATGGTSPFTVDGGAGTADVFLDYGATSAGVYMGTTANPDLGGVFYFAGSDTLNFRTADGDRSYVNATGYFQSGGRAYFNDGAVGTPAYTFFSEGDLGMWRVTTDTLAFSTAGAERMRLDASGDVSFGTAADGAAINGGRAFEIANLQNTATNTDNQDFIVRSANRNAYITIRSSNTLTAALAFGDVAGAAQGGVFYDNNVDSMSFRVNAQNRWVISSAGVLTSDATNGGDLIFARTGTTVSVQEATPASACMGVATPNGTTNVTVTTSCAVANARVFYSRVGAVTNMGVISTTTAPAGTSFTFASVNAADTLASSVVWWIVKESA